MSRTFYDALGVDEDASTEEIRSAYRAKVKETHPDVSDANDAEERFKRVTRAKEVLTDAAERDRYDRLGHQQYVTAVEGTEAERTDGQQTNDGRGSARDRSTRSDRDNGATTGGRATADGRTTSDPFGWSGDKTESGSERQGTDSGGDAEEASSGSRSSSWHQSGGTGQASGGSSYATRTTYSEQSVDRVRVPLTPGTLIQIGAMFVLYPVFVVASVFPPFPTAVNVLVGLCTLFVIAYLVSVPEVAIVVFGAWSLLTPLLFVSLPGLALVSVWAVAALVVTWFPFGLAVLTQYALRT